MHTQHNSCDDRKIKQFKYDDIEYKNKNYCSITFKNGGVIKNYVYYYEPVKLSSNF